MAATFAMNRAQLKACAPALPARSARALALRALPKDSRIETAQVALLVAGTSSFLAEAAHAETALTPVQTTDGVDSAVSAAVQAVQATGSAVKAGLDIVGTGLGLVKQGVDLASPYVKQAVDAVAPVVETAVKATAEVATPAIQKAAPVVKESLTSALRSTGINTSEVANTTSAVTAKAEASVTAAKPFLSQVLSFFASKDPVTLAEYGLAAAALVYLGPPAFGLFLGSLRGFAGEITATSAVDMVVKEGDAVIIDIRTFDEKEKSGVPDVPASASGKLVEVEYAVTEDKKLRGQLRDANGVEAQVTALQIAALKRIGKGSKVILLDRYGNTARTVAKELTRKGFGKVFTIAGGFDGRSGWVQSKLQVKPVAAVYSGPFALPGSIGRTVSTRKVDGAGRKALPAARA